MKKRDARVLRGIALAVVAIMSLVVAFLAAGPAGAWDPRVTSCLEQVVFTGLLAAFVGSSLLVTRGHR